MCTIDWALLAAVVGALSTVGLLGAALYGLDQWKSQFLATRDHDLAGRILRAIADSHIVFHEIRTPHALFSDADEPVAPETSDDLPGEFEHRKMFARYRARSRHLVAARQARTAALFEALSLWDQRYAVHLGTLINQLAAIEDSVLQEATNFVEFLALGPPDPNLPYDHNVLFHRETSKETDGTNDEYQAVRNAIIEHLGPKLRMERQKKKSPAGAGL